MIIVLISYYLELIDILRCRGFRGRAPRVGATPSGLPGPSTQGGCYTIWASGAEHPGWVLHHPGFRGRAPRVVTPLPELPGPSTQGGYSIAGASVAEYPGWVLHCRGIGGARPRARERRAASVRRGFRCRPPCGSLPHRGTPCDECLYSLRSDSCVPAVASQQSWSGKSARAGSESISARAGIG